MLVREQRLARLLVVVFFVFAVLLFAFNEIVDATSNRLRCFVPQEFTTEWAYYAETKCSELKAIRKFSDWPSHSNWTDDLEKAYSNVYSTPFLLVTLALILWIPQGIWLLMERGLHLFRTPDEQNSSSSRGPIICLLVSESVLVICISVCLALVENFTSNKLGFSARQEAGAILSRATRTSLMNTELKDYFCDFGAKKLGRNVIFTLQCAISQRATFVTARMSALMAWAVLVSYLAWAIISSTAKIIFIISPTARRNLLSAPEGAPEKKRAVPLQPLMPALW